MSGSLSPSRFRLGPWITSTVIGPLAPPAAASPAFCRPLTLVAIPAPLLAFIEPHPRCDCKRGHRMLSTGQSSLESSERDLRAFWYTSRRPIRSEEHTSELQS